MLFDVDGFFAHAGHDHSTTATYVKHWRANVTEAFTRLFVVDRMAPTRTVRRPFRREATFLWLFDVCLEE